jgi:hypothetical protein
MWELLVTIGDLLDRCGSGWSTLGKTERLETRQIVGLTDISYVDSWQAVNDPLETSKQKPPEGGFILTHQRVY